LIKSNNIEKIENVINRVINDNKWGEQLLNAKIPDIWEDIVGETISKISKVLNFAEGVLYVLVDSSTWKVELKFRKNEIIEKMNEKLDGNYIKDIVFKI